MQKLYVLFHYTNLDEFDDLVTLLRESLQLREKGLHDLTLALDKNTGLAWSTSEEGLSMTPLKLQSGDKE